MKNPIAYGIDFGTTNSALAVAFDDGTTEVLNLGDGAPFIPSLIYLNRDGNRLAGPAGLRGFLDLSTQWTSCGRCALRDGVRGRLPCRQARPGGRCLDSRLFSQVKSDLTDAEFGSTHSWGIDFELEDLVAAVMATMKRAADRKLGADVRRVVLGRPVRFAGAAGPQFSRRQDIAEGRLREAGRRAGFKEIRMVAESQAAVALDEIDRGIAVCVDFGGGTFDLAVVDVTGSKGEIRHLDGVAVGGEEFDAKIFDAFIRPALRLDATFQDPHGQPRQLPARLRSRLRSLAGLRSLLADPGATQALTDYAGQGNDAVLHRISELLYGGQAWGFYKALEATKVALSTAEVAEFEFHRRGFDLRVPVRRSQFEMLIAADLDRIRYCLKDSIDAAGITASEVAYVTRTGGSSQIPAFIELLRDMFPTARLIERDPFTCVVSGLARYAAGEWVS